MQQLSVEGKEWQCEWERNREWRRGSGEWGKGQAELKAEPGLKLDKKLLLRLLLLPAVPQS